MSIVTLSNIESIPAVSIIINCKNEGSNLIKTVNSMISSQNTIKFEIIIIDDGSNDGCSNFIINDSKTGRYKNLNLIKTNSVGIAQGRNAGARLSKGKYLFFCDAHIIVPPKWIDNLVYSLVTSNADIINPCIVDMNNPHGKGYGFKIDNNFNVLWRDRVISSAEIPLASGAVMGVKRSTFEKLGGFEKLFAGYGSEDLEFSIRAWLFGYKIIINPFVEVQHLFGKRGYCVAPVDPIFNLICLAYFHFNKQRILKIVNRVASQESYPEVVKLINKIFDDIMHKRYEYFNKRLYDDSYFFDKFSMDF